MVTTTISLGTKPIVSELQRPLLITAPPSDQNRYSLLPYVIARQGLFWEKGNKS